VDKVSVAHHCNMNGNSLKTTASQESASWEGASPSDLATDSGRMTSHSETMRARSPLVGSPTRFVPRNALVAIDDANSRMVGKPEVIQRRGSAKPISTLGATLRLVEKHISRHLAVTDQIHSKSGPEFQSTRYSRRRWGFPFNFASFRLRQSLKSQGFADPKLDLGQSLCSG